MFWRNAYFFALALSFIFIFSSFNFALLNIPVYGQTPGPHISQEQYDKIKNCACCAHYGNSI